MSYKFGKTPARPDAVKLRMMDYVHSKELGLAELPKHPLGPFGHQHIIRESHWGMLGNDKAGDCVWAGAAHETKMLAGLGKKQVWFSEKEVLADYSQVTGYDPSKTDAHGDNPTDNGTDMQLAAKFRQNTGIRDGHGNRHRIAAYMSIDPGNLEQHLIAIYLFGAVGVGIEVPSYAPDQFDAQEPWDVRVGGKQNIVGGHYIMMAYWGGKDQPELQVVTWGANQGMTPRFLSKFNDESIVYLSPEFLIDRRSPEGFDYDTLVADLQQIRNVA